MRFRIVLLTMSALAVSGCDGPTAPDIARAGVATVVEHWGRMTRIANCGPTSMTGHLEVGIRTRESNGGTIAYTEYTWSLIERAGTPTEDRRSTSSRFPNSEVVIPYGYWEARFEADMTKDYDTTYELTVISVATATGATTPLFVTGKIIREGCN